MLYSGQSLRNISESYDRSKPSDDTSEPSDDTSKPADDALASDPDSSRGKAQGSQGVPEIAVEDSDERSAIEDSQPSEPLDVESSGVGASSDVEVRAQTKSPKAISSRVLCMKKEESSIDLEEEDTGRNEPSPASITFKALETTDSKEIDLTILGNIAREHCAKRIAFEQSNVIRTLGLGWIQREDCFLYGDQSLEKTSATTTSEMLSFITKLEDPLRWNTQGVQLHGFGDDSEDAYAAAVYMRIPTDDGVGVKLLASRTKLAPMRKMSIPRLELCAALLLTRLMENIMEELDIKLESDTCWSDSTILRSRFYLAQHQTKELAAVLANDGTKWKTISPSVDINTPVETHPGKDGLVRVVSVRTSVGVLRGPLVKMVLLPVAPPDLDEGRTSLPSCKLHVRAVSIHGYLDADSSPFERMPTSSPSTLLTPRLRFGFRVIAIDPCLVASRHRPSASYSICHFYWIPGQFKTPAPWHVPLNVSTTPARYLQPPDSRIPGHLTSRLLP
ncbi:hypothetical protein LAZ67_3001892 [Cordylochernes scorpioides]|uniref:DUF5641 domain-containing protein n=1 Tax=Cordylochernes scorpioides TaxID=51811 RepID=A0ABY6K7H3_9ARAC|nr:hypothetical protein LAZ67_3001892 [Cordylochernes scorpioides]